MVIDKRLLVACAVVATTACTVHDTQTPSLSGPSGLGLTLRVSATPDTVNQDGGSQSSIRVTAIGPDGRPAASVPLRMDIEVLGVPQDFGTLSARTIVTSSDGTAGVVFTAPPAPPNGIYLNNCNGLAGTCLNIVAAATGTNIVNTNPESVRIRLVPTGVILPPASTPTAAFTVNPTPVNFNISSTFDASSSQAGSGATQIVKYEWSFGDGATASGRSVNHTYSGATQATTTFNVMLTVTNDRGLSATTTQQVQVGPSPVPTGDFVFS